MQSCAEKSKLSSGGSDRRGFALPVVLAGLLLVTALFATAQQRGLASLAQIETERRLLQNLEERAEALELTRAALSMDPEIRQIEVPDDSGRRLFLQDVGGLIDLNTAHPDLLRGLAQTLGIDQRDMERLRMWRQNGRRLLSLQDFRRLVGLPWQKAEVLPGLATVSSGRFGIDPLSAPHPVKDIASAGGSDIPEQFLDLPSRTVFSVELLGQDSAIKTYVGVVQIVDAHVFVLESY